jgi:hypothetical protein
VISNSRLKMVARQGGLRLTFLFDWVGNRIFAEFAVRTWSPEGLRFINFDTAK